MLKLFYFLPHMGFCFFLLEYNR